MNNVEVTTVSPVHIGKALKLLNGFEFMQDEKSRDIYLLDEEKILMLIQKRRPQEDIRKIVDQWTAIIGNQGNENRNLNSFIKTNLGEIKYEEISTRKINAVCKLTQQELMMHFRSATGKPQIPGSSIKGAIRTAVLASVINTKETGANNLIDSFNKKNRFEYKDNLLVREITGDIQGNLFKFLRVGDANFNETYCDAVKIINKLHDGWEYQIKGRKNVIQQAELIPTGKTSVCRIIFSDKHPLINNPHSIIRNKNSNKHHLENIQTLNVKNLFPLIHKHTLSLIKKEVDFLEKEEDGALQDYYDALFAIYDRAEEYNANECLLRLGYGSGYDFMTGGWTKSKLSEQDWNDLKRYGLRAQSSVYPKTRRFTSNGSPLGFVKLTLL